MVSITMGCQSCITMFRSRPIKLEKLACRALTVRRSKKMQDGFFFSIIENLERTLKVRESRELENQSRIIHKTIFILHKGNDILMEKLPTQKHYYISHH